MYKFRFKIKIDGKLKVFYFSLDEIIEGALNKIEYKNSFNIIEKSIYLGFSDKNEKEVFDGDKLDFDQSEWGGKFEPEKITFAGIAGDWCYCGSFSDVTEWRKIVD